MFLTCVGDFFFPATSVNITIVIARLVVSLLMTIQVNEKIADAMKVGSRSCFFREKCVSIHEV